MIHLGTYKEALDRRTRAPLIVEKKGIRVALLNYTYSTNGLATKKPNIVNMIDKNRMLQDIQFISTRHNDR